MSELQEIDKRVRQQLRRYGVRLPRAEPELHKVRRKYNPLDYICSHYDGQDRPSISIRVGGREWLVRHEYGHFLVDYFGLKRLAAYDAVFGGGWSGWEYELLVPVARVTDTVLRKCFGVKPPFGLPTFYALLGGEEDFCECLAMLLSTRGRTTVDNEKLRRKLETVRRLLKMNCRRKHTSGD